MNGSDGFASFFAAHHTALVRTMWGYCGDRDLAEEAAQEALTRAARDWERVSAMTSPAGWLHRVAMNEVNGYFRRLRSRARALARHGVRESDDPVDVPAVVSVREAMRRLPARQRAAVVLFYFADLSIAEVAEVLDVPQGTVKSHLARARTSMAAHLEVDVMAKEVNDVG